MALSKKKSRELSIKEKVLVIKQKESEGKSQRELAKIFGVSKTQIQSTLKRKADVLAAYEDNLPNDRKRIKTFQFEEDIDLLTFRWFQRARSLNLPISGPLIQEKALSFANSLKKTDFKASNGWLNRFKTRHSISHAVISGESGSVDEDVVESWKLRLPAITAGYATRDIYNMDESGMFYRALPDKTLKERNTECKGGKKSKERITAMFCVNMDGEFEKTLVIGKSKNPRCFKSIDTRTLPVEWEHNKKLWMTSGIYQRWLQNFDRRMQRQNRQVLLLLDNAPSHPKDVNLSNVKVVFLPANTTSKLQPLDQGIIKAIKTIYRKRLLQFVLAKMERGEDVMTLSKCVSVLDAIHWINTAVQQVRSTTVKKCFLRCGIGHAEADDSSTSDDEDNVGLSELVSRVQSHLDLPSQSVDDFTACDNDLETCDNATSNLENRILEEYHEQQNKVSNSDKCDDEENLPEENEESSSTKNCKKNALTSIGATLKCVEDIKSFLLERNAPHLLTPLYEIEKGLCEMSTAAMKQKSIRDFFNVNSTCSCE